MRIECLYHWAPSSRRKDILRDGLKVYSEAVTHTKEHGAAPYLCFATRPSQAWGLSGNMSWVSEVEEWDLWEFHPSADSGSSLHVNPCWGNNIEEVRTYQSIPPDKLWWVGQRVPQVFE